MIHRITVSFILLSLFKTPSLFVTSSRTCGDGSVGDGICYDPSLCCSKFGYCDTSEEHCLSSENCGNGRIGNGRCDDSSLCCSVNGYCGTTAQHCEGTTPEQQTSSSIRRNDIHTAAAPPHLIAFLGNWQDCPTASQLASYTHIVISFAVSYTWSPQKNICSTTCQIAEPAICKNQILSSNNNKGQRIKNEWQAQGKKVLLSFGGAGMGGSWDGDINDCWEYCYGREAQVVTQLVDLVDRLGLDGIDIDFEYDVTSNAVQFLTKVTQGLRDKLPADAELSHAPMDSDIVPGKPYYDEVLKEVGPLLDFLMPQYYNGVTRPALDGIIPRSSYSSGAMATLDHYENLVHDIMEGDATRVVFGFCINDCGGTNSNINAGQASIILQDLADHFPCHGGAFFWVVQHDSNGQWSKPVKTALDNIAFNHGCAQSPPPLIVPQAPPLILPAPPTEPTNNDDFQVPPSLLEFWEYFTALFLDEDGDDEEVVVVEQQPPAQKTEPPTAPIVCCPPNFTGLRAYGDCTQYYHCVHGTVTGPLLKVPVGTLFDERMQITNFASLVTCSQSSSSSSCSGTRNLRYQSQ